MMRDIKDEAHNRWRSILPQFDVSPSFLTGKHTGCPLCGGKDRFRFDDKDGRGTWICNQCGAGDGVSLVMQITGLLFRDAVISIRDKLPASTITKAKAPRIAPPDAARDLWRASQPVGRDQAEAYLMARGFRGPWPSSLRFAPSCRVADHADKKFLPAMLALIAGPDGQGVNVHRTYLEGAAKANMASPRKVMAGTIPDGSAIRLAAHRGILGVAEGIETALAVTRDFGVPCWSLLNATMMSKFIPPSDVRELHIYGDNDGKFGGQAAAYALAHRAATRKDAPIVTVHLPPIVGTDFADCADTQVA